MSERKCCNILIVWESTSSDIVIDWNRDLQMMDCQTVSEVAKILSRLLNLKLF